MNQKKKWIIICVFAFLLLAGVLLVKGMQKTNTNKINTASENISNHLVTGQAVSPSAVIKEESVKKKSKTSGQNKKNTEKKDKKIKAEQKKETTKSPQKTPKKPKATPSIKPAKEPKITPTASPTKKPVEPKKTVTFSIHCKEILEHKDLWKEGIEEIIPKDGSFFNGTVEFTQGETVYDVQRIILHWIVYLLHYMEPIISKEWEIFMNLIVEVRVVGSILLMANCRGQEVAIM